MKNKFTDALAAMKDQKQLDHGKKKTIAMQGREYCDALFDLEKQMQGCSFAEKQKKREALAKPILEEMSRWLQGVQVKSKSKTGEALTHLKHQWPYLIRYLRIAALKSAITAPREASDPL